MLKHQLVVVGQVRFALYSVYNQHFGFLARRRHQFDMRGEARTAQTYYTCILNLLDDLFRLECALMNETFRAVNLRKPLVTFYVNVDGRCRLSLTVKYVVNLCYSAAHRRVNGSAYKSSGLGEQCTYFHLVTNCHNRLSRSTYVLRKQDYRLLGQRSLYDRLMRGERFVVMRMNSAYTKCILHNILQIFKSSNFQIIKSSLGSQSILRQMA